MTLEPLTATDLLACDPVVLTEALVDAHDVYVAEKSPLRALLAKRYPLQGLDASFEALGKDLRDRDVDEKMAKGELDDAREDIEATVGRAIRFVGDLLVGLEPPLRERNPVARRIARAARLRSLHKESSWREVGHVIGAVARELAKAGDALAEDGLGADTAQEARDLEQALFRARRVRTSASTEHGAARVLTGAKLEEARRLLLDLDSKTRFACQREGTTIERPWLATVNQLVGAREAARDASRARAAALAQELAAPDDDAHAAARRRVEEAVDALLDEVDDAPAATAPRPLVVT